ncbi:hypothetical protein A1O3_03620 [Capronia epimyces CBS 606.96]|uniref:NmrA-like domain-containing protein n=1 Tax=Capronia epimyces CBS 606.96 TaxID=1182542 RepID=W9Y1H4_9EURO|nr:uncharacterized protein A1O3_03620 [Capronia epimyces CBS 606.96]EXJ86667.1 hypothetical protein A1O3_03620 [Capronia epimyces CBS 606.96]
MAQQSQDAKDQGQGFKNHVENIAIVGATGRIGAFITQELLKTKKHKVTALTRADSSSSNKLATVAGLTIQPVNYDEPESLVSALRGQEVLIITMAVTAPPDQEAKLIRAAAEAGVAWVMPNEWGLDPWNEALAQESYLGDARKKARDLIVSLGKSAYISLVCGMWYEFSLSGGPERYGFDLPNRTVTFFDDGNTKVNTSTWEQCGRAMARLLSLKVVADDTNDNNSTTTNTTTTTTTPTLSQFKNGFVYISSFLLSQRDMFQSVLRATATSEADWSVKYQDVKTRYNEGLVEMQKGTVAGFVQVLYSRYFYPDGSGCHEARHGLHNDLLGLPKEDLDHRTKLAIVMAEEGESAGRV